MFRRLTAVGQSLDTLSQTMLRALELGTPERLAPYYRAYIDAYRVLNTDAAPVDDNIYRAVAHFFLQSLRDESVTFTPQSLKIRLLQHFRTQNTAELDTGEPKKARLSDDESDDGFYAENPARRH